MTEDTTVPDRATWRELVPLIGLGLAIAIVAELIGKFSIPVGPATITIYPMVWGLLIGALVSMQPLVKVSTFFQRNANALVGLFVLLLVARLSFNIGPELTTVLDAGPALMLQEIGHMLGTLVLALPLAVMLSMGPATIGATFSLDREPAFAMVNEKYGPDSDQYRGVLAMYVFGTLFGAVTISFLTSAVASLDIFHPHALAMGVGVGSGSMMAAGVASIVDLYPGDENAVTGLAAVSNLITTIAGVYVGIYVALPLADRLYHLLTRGKHAQAADGSPLRAGAKGQDGGADDNRDFRDKMAKSLAPVKVPLWVSMSAITAIGLVTATLVTGQWSIDYLWGYLIMDALILLSMLLHKLTRVISAIIWVTTIGAAAASPWSPIQEFVVKYVSSVDFLSITTVVLVMAGLSIGKDVPLLRRIGWKIVPVGLVAIFASFIFSVIIAEFTLGYWSF